MFMFSRKRPNLLGIDISSSAVKLVELGRAGNRYRVERYAVVPLAPDAVVDKGIVKQEVVGAAVQQAVRQAGTKLTHAAVALPGSAVITKVITMPANLGEDDLEQQLQLEADQYIPYSLDEVALDFQSLGPNANNPLLVNVLLAVTRKENVESRVAAVELGGLTVEVADAEPFALENALPLIESQLPVKVGDQRSIALVDVGATAMGFHVAKNGAITYTREQGFGGKQLTEEIQRRYGLSHEEATLAKKQGGLPESYIADVLEPFKHALAQQVSRLLQFYITSTAERGVDCIVLAGGCAAIAGIDRVVVEQTGVMTVVANPFIDMSSSSQVKVHNLAREAPAMMVACGLAQRSFD